MKNNALIVDDNPQNLEALALLLQKEGMKPFTVQSPKELYALLDTSSFNVIFLDLEFPNHSGLDIIETLKGDARLNGVPIVAYSVHTSELNEAKAAGFDSFIGKPLRVDRFPRQLRQILNGESIWEVE